MTLNVDEWRLVVQQLEHDLFTLSNLLLVSTTQFHLVLPVLYRSPFKLIRRNISHEGCSRNERQLQYLLDFCTGFDREKFFPKVERDHRFDSWLAALQGIGTVTTTTITSTTPTTATTTATSRKMTVDYSKFVVHITTVDKYARQSVEWLDVYAEKLVSLDLDPELWARVLHLASRFKNLENASVDQFGPTKRVEDRHIDAAVQFIQIHKLHFPGLLKKINFPFRQWGQGDDVFHSVQRALEPVQSLYVALPQIPTLVNSIPSTFSRLTTLEITHQMTGSLVEARTLRSFLLKCRNLQVLKAALMNSFAFHYAINEFRLYQEQQ